MIICPKCEEKNINDRKFCKKCGYLLAGCIQVDSSLVTNYKPTELRIADYSLSTDLAICKAVNKLPIIKSAVEKLITYWNLPMEKRKLLGDAVKVDKNQLNSIYELVEYSSRVLNIAIPEVYVKYDPQFNAYTYGTNDDNVIVLNSSLVDTFTQDELLFVIGHEMGHIKSQHVTYLSIGSLLSTGYSAFSKFWFNPLRVPLDAWSREAEFSVDRAGYLVSQVLQPI